MIKLSVNEAKWSSLLAKTLALTLYISIWIFDFGPEELPGLFEKRAPESKIYWQILESSIWYPESTVWIPESKTVLDHLIWGENVIV